MTSGRRVYRPRKILIEIGEYGAGNVTGKPITAPGRRVAEVEAAINNASVRVAQPSLELGCADQRALQDHRPAG